MSFNSISLLFVPLHLNSRRSCLLQHPPLWEPTTRKHSNLNLCFLLPSTTSSPASTSSSQFRSSVFCSSTRSPPLAKSFAWFRDCFTSSHCNPRIRYSSRSFRFTRLLLLNHLVRLHFHFRFVLTFLRLVGSPFLFGPFRLHRLPLSAPSSFLLRSETSTLSFTVFDNHLLLLCWLSLTRLGVFCSLSTSKLDFHMLHDEALI